MGQLSTGAWQCVTAEQEVRGHTLCSDPLLYTRYYTSRVIDHKGTANDFAPGTSMETLGLPSLFYTQTNTHKGVLLNVSVLLPGGRQQWGRRYHIAVSLGTLWTKQISGCCLPAAGHSFREAARKADGPVSDHQNPEISPTARPWDAKLHAPTRQQHLGFNPHVPLCGRERDVIKNSQNDQNTGKSKQTGSVHLCNTFKWVFLTFYTGGQSQFQWLGRT